MVFVRWNHDRSWEIYLHYVWPGTWDICEYCTCTYAKKDGWEDKTLNSKSKVDLARIPPCLDSLIPHIQRCNHRLAWHKRAHQAIIEKPKPYDTDQSWCKVEGGSLEPVWTKGPILPLSLIELLDSGDWDDEDEEDESIDYEDIFDILLKKLFIF